VKLKNHPYADLFPMMSATELEALATDIVANGLLQPVILYQGTVLDGRNRLSACGRAGVEPQFTEFDGDDAAALALVISLNVQRRDLTGAQRAVVAARAWGLDGYGKGGRPEKGKPVSSKLVSLESLAKQFKIAKFSITQARDLLAEAADLAAQVESCTLSLAEAYGGLKGRRKEAAQKAKDARRVAQYADAISGGEMNLEEALQHARGSGSWGCAGTAHCALAASAAMAPAWQRVLGCAGASLAKSVT
jgi:ParB-like chromosome segregation protein Spo0J